MIISYSFQLLSDDWLPNTLHVYMLPHLIHTTANELNTIIPFFGWRNWSMEKLTDASRVTELLNGDSSSRLIPKFMFLTLC